MFHWSIPFNYRIRYKRLSSEAFNLSQVMAGKNAFTFLYLFFWHFSTNSISYYKSKSIVLLQWIKLNVFFLRIRIRHLLAWIKLQNYSHTSSSYSKSFWVSVHLANEFLQRLIYKLKQLPFASFLQPASSFLYSFSFFLSSPHHQSELVELFPLLYSCEMSISHSDRVAWRF